MESGRRRAGGRKDGVSEELRVLNKMARERAGQVVECLCNRRTLYVSCRVCLYAGPGRLARICPQHITTIFLHDVKFCPRCNASCVHMDEHLAP